RQQVILGYWGSPYWCPSLGPSDSSPSPPDAISPFQYDWHSLRVAGLVVAAILCVIGIIVLLSECHRGVPTLGTFGTWGHMGGHWGHGDT
uniref:FXYD domain-containing ion transport regulator n=1 Tax=Strix occidentalis caurina TaxID=311401 RepID=A0A8D0F6A1_STROC